MGDFGGDCSKTRKTEFTPDPPASEVTKEIFIELECERITIFTNADHSVQFLDNFSKLNFY